MPRNGKLLVSEAIAQLAPNVQFSLSNEDFSTIQWIDTPPNPIPTLDQVNAVIAAYVPPPSIQDQLAALQTQVAQLLATQGK